MKLEFTKDKEKEIEVVIIARIWFQKSHSVIVFVNKKYVGFKYGNGSQYELTGLSIAREYINANHQFTLSETVSGRESQKVRVISLDSDVPRKKDLAFSINPNW